MYQQKSFLFLCKQLLMAMINQYLCDQFLLMSLEEQQLIEHIEDLPYQSLKFNNQNTAIYTKPRNICQSAVFDLQPFPQSPLECSFDQVIHEENIQILKNATIKYLEETITSPFDKNEGFKDPSLFENLPFEVGGQNDLELLTRHNEHFTEKEQKDLFQILKEEQELIGFIRLLAPTFGITIGKELIYIIHHVLKFKLVNYRELMSPKEGLLPRFNCFYGSFSEENTFGTSCPVYQDLLLEEIPLFAQKQLDDICSQLFFSCQIKYLNLREIKSDLKDNVYPLKFSNLIKQISRTVFYTLSGSVEPTNLCGSSIFALDLSREVSFSEFPEANILSIQRSLSRPFVTCEDEQIDFISKRLKFE